MAFGTLFVGIAEEVAFRGIIVRAIRGSTSKEWIVMIGSSLLFGLVHGINFFNGQSFGKTITQVTLAAILGSTLYVILRLSGSLLLPILIHAIWDFSTLSLPDDFTKADAVNGVGLTIVYLGTPVAYCIIFRRNAQATYDPAEPATVPATASE
jgi:membrane protease YdiL (CAAX protease family)